MLHGVTVTKNEVQLSMKMLRCIETGTTASRVLLNIHRYEKREA